MKSKWNARENKRILLFFFARLLAFYRRQTFAQIYTRSHFSIVVYRYTTGKQHQQRQKKKNCTWFSFVSRIDVCADCVYDFFHASCHSGVRLYAFDVSRFILMAHDNILKCQYTLNETESHQSPLNVCIWRRHELEKWGKNTKKPMSARFA